MNRPTRGWRGVCRDVQKHFSDSRPCPLTSESLDYFGREWDDIDDRHTEARLTAFLLEKATMPSDLVSRSGPSQVKSEAWKEGLGLSRYDDRYRTDTPIGDLMYANA